jgi:hypothetical protein
MKHRHFSILFVLAMCLLLLGAIALAGCASGTGTEDDSSSTSLSSISTAPASSNSTTTVPQLTATEFDKELAKTANTQRALTEYLAEQQAADQDPRFAIIYGLRARSQAITGRQAIDKGDLTLADTAMKDVYSTLNLARGLATGEAKDILTAAYETVQDLGHPSDAPDNAAIALERFIDKLEPLIDEANAIIPATTTTTAGS